MKWYEICSERHYSGRWVALDECQYEGNTQSPDEAIVVDADDDLGALCNRMKKAARQCCTVLFAEPPRRSRTISRH